jgi:type VI secretion system protein ImpK
MSNSGDPFGRNNKTVLRLNPGGRRAAPAQPPQPGPPAGQPAYPPQGYPQPSYPQPPAQPAYPQPPPPGYGAPPSYAPPAPPPSYAPQPYPAGQHQSQGQGGPGGTGDAWFRAVQPPPIQEATGALILKRDVPIAAHANLLVEAAGPLLLLLGRLRTSLMSANFANLMDQVADAVEEFDKTMRAESVPKQTAEDAKYALCATCDDIVQHIPSEERHIWARYSMLSRFFGERTGGVSFFDKLERAKQDPSANYDLIELMYACMAVGFQGVHRTTAGGAATLQTIHRNTYELLRRIKARSKEDLSPHWRGLSLPTSGSVFRIPIWVLSAIAAIGLFGAFITLRTLLSGSTEAVTVEMARMFPDTQIGIERPAMAAPAPPVRARTSTQLQRIRGRLQPEIDANKVDPIESGASIIVRVGAFTLFDSGRADAKPDFEPVARKIALALNEEPGEIRIVGHSDNVRITTTRFASNYELSLERAKAVAQLLRPHLTQPDRLKVEGKGDASPIASNATAEGRSRNRRVDISIPREETLRTNAPQ